MIFVHSFPSSGLGTHTLEALLPGTCIRPTHAISPRSRRDDLPTSAPSHGYAYLLVQASDSIDQPLTFTGIAAEIAVGVSFRRIAQWLAAFEGVQVNISAQVPIVSLGPSWVHFDLKLVLAFLDGCLQWSQSLLTIFYWDVRC